MSDQRRQFIQSRGLSASYSQLGRTGIQNSNVSRLSVRSQGATPEIVVTPLRRYTVPSVQEPFFDEFAVQELRAGLIPSTASNRLPLSFLMQFFHPRRLSFDIVRGVGDTLRMTQNCSVVRIFAYIVCF